MTKKTINKYITLIIITTTIIINSHNLKNIYLSYILGYNKKSITTFIEGNIYNDIKNYEYSKTLETIINTEYYDQNYLKEYLQIEYINNETFLKNISLLLNKGYNSNEINIINKFLTKESINIISNNKYIKDIINIISLEYFKEEKLERYINYYQKEELDIETIITYVNIGLDNKYYTNVINIENQEDIYVLVNKYNKLQEDFIPENLKLISSDFGHIKLKEDASIAFNNMCKEALKNDIYIYGGSGYRSYEYQNKLYNNYVDQDGVKNADTYSARPGYSEHQTGLAIDIMNKNWEYVNETDKEYDWLLENSYKYGFILRYPLGKEKITGYIYEPWHYRYIGIDLATKITNQKITYEEYVAKNS